jgi:hypothetical protein
LNLSVRAQNAVIGAVAALFDGAVLRIYDLRFVAGGTTTTYPPVVPVPGTPVSPQAPVPFGALLLATVPFATPAFRAPVGGAAALTGFIAGPVVGPGSYAQWGRITSVTGQVLCDLTIGPAVTGADLVFPGQLLTPGVYGEVLWNIGGTVFINTLTLRQP